MTDSAGKILPDQSSSQVPIGVSIVVPVYNEKINIKSFLVNLAGIVADIECPSEIIVVNDGSTDGSGELLQANRGDIHLIEHPSNRGYGAALKSGVLAAQHELILIIDSDGTYPYEVIPELVQCMVDKDMVIAARIGPHVKIPTIRKPAKWFLAKLANFLTGSKIPDLNSGLRIVRKKILKQYIDLLPDGFSFTTTITIAMICDRYKIEYFPINYNIRKGRSKIRPIRDTLNFLQLIVSTILYFKPLKVFLPCSMGLMVLSFILFCYRLFMGGEGFLATIVLLFLAGMQLLALGMIADLIVRKSKWNNPR